MSGIITEPSLVTPGGEVLETAESLAEKIEARKQAFVKHWQKESETLKERCELFLTQVVGKQLDDYALAAIDFVSEQVRFEKRVGNEIHYLISGIAPKQVYDAEGQPTGATFAPYWDSGIRKL